MPLKLPRFERSISLVDADGKPSLAFHQWWQNVVTAIEKQEASQDTVIADLEAQLALIQAAQADADAAQANAIIAQADAAAAQEDAIAAYREAARINSYSSPTSILTAADAGTDASITVANHTRVYPVQGSIDVPDVAITGATITGLAFSTTYYIYYDDTTLAATAPTFVATTSSSVAHVGAAAGRHFIGKVVTPADGGTNTSGDGPTAPGGGEILP